MEVGAQLLIVRLNDPSGSLLEVSVPVQVVLPAPGTQLFLVRTPRTGEAPLQVTLRATFLGHPTAYQWDVDGNGTIDAAGAELAEVAHTYQTPGVYVPKLIVSNDQGAPFMQQAPVLAFFRDDVIALLQLKWQAFKDALRVGDVAGALGYIAQGSRDRYRLAMQNLTVPFSDIDRVLTSLQFVGFRDLSAEFEMLRTDERGRLSYLVRFIVDEDGIWRLQAL